MLRETVARLEPVVPLRDFWVVTNAEQSAGVRRELSGYPAVLAVLNLGADPVQVVLPSSAACETLTGHGMHGSAVNGTISLGAFGGWFGEQRNA